MAEVQTSTESGQMAQLFIEMVMMQAQNAAYALGQIPHPETGEAPVNLDLAKIFIDQLIVLRAKTKGNLANDEQAVLNNAISNLQMVYVEVAKGGGSASAVGESDAREEIGDAVGEAAVEAGAEADEAKPAEPAGEAPSEESRKKFTKSYGA